MSTATRAEVVASVLLRPVPVLLTIVTITTVGSLLGQAWAFAVFWSLTIIIGGLALTVLAGAPPLPRLADRSHLLARLSWLGRYGTAAFLLCVSTFLGGLVGTAIPGSSAQQAVDGLTSLVQTVGLYAGQAAVVIFLLWLAIDTGRLRREGRQEGFTRSVAYIAGIRVARLCDHPAITRWVIAITSPLLVSLVAAIVIIWMFLQTTALRA